MLVVMFLMTNPKADLRLIDFGSGCIDKPQQKLKAVDREDVTEKDSDGSRRSSGELDVHSTFAGTPFYLSPEMYQRMYTQKTDVWSVGVLLYVLVAGYPSEQLQTAFNILQKSKDRNLRELPGLPCDIPDSYYELLESLLTYRHKSRPSAGDLLSQEFVIFHKEIMEESVSEMVTAPSTRTKMRRTASISLRTSAVRHKQVLGFKSFECSLTTLLVTLLSSNDLKRLVGLLRHHVGTQTLNVVLVKQLKEILVNDFENTEM